jgi:hypothetical protein
MKRKNFSETSSRLNKEIECSICLSIPKIPFRLKCSHAFCLLCILKWSKKNLTCPCCRTDMQNIFENMNKRFIKKCRQLTVSMKKELKLFGCFKTNRLFEFVVINKTNLYILEDNTKFVTACINTHSKHFSKYKENFTKLKQVLESIKQSNEQLSSN